MSSWKPPSNVSRCSGRTRDHPTAMVDILAPVSGVITDQQVTAASGTQGLGSPNAFTISDLSRVWVLCDVYENDLAVVTPRRGGRDSSERLSEHRPQGTRQQYRSDSRPQYPYRQGARRSRESGDDAPRHVRSGQVPRPADPGPRRGPGLRNSAPSRPRLGLCVARAQTHSAASKCAAGR